MSDSGNAKWVEWHAPFFADLTASACKGQFCSGLASWGAERGLAGVVIITIALPPEHSPDR